MCALLDTESNLNSTTKQHAMVYIKLNVVTRRMSYLDLGPPVPIGTLGDEVPPSVRSLAIIVASSQLSATPIILRSSRSVSCHVF